MDNDILSVIQKLLELGWPAIVLLFLIVLWRDYKAMQKEFIDVLKEIAGLRVSLAPSTPDKSPAFARLGGFSASDEELTAHAAIGD